MILLLRAAAMAFLLLPSGCGGGAGGDSGHGHGPNSSSDPPLAAAAAAAAAVASVVALVAAHRRIAGKVAGGSYPASWIRHAGLVADFRPGAGAGFSAPESRTDATAAAAAPNHPSPASGSGSTSASGSASSRIGALADECGRPALADPARFAAGCLGGITALVSAEPTGRWCEAAMDSAHPCPGEGGGEHGAGGTVLRGRELMRDLFAAPLEENEEEAEATAGGASFVNVAVVGAGPAGLALAGALAGLSASPGGGVEYRVLVFENRLLGGRGGTKAPYSRDWITELDSSLLCGGNSGADGEEEGGDGALPPSVLDGDTCRLLRVLHTDREDGGGDDYSVILPLNVLETLLLLSGRGRGVRYLYADYTNYLEVLRDVPNLVVFDATGHRLERLERGSGTAVGTAGDVCEGKEEGGAVVEILDSFPATPAAAREARRAHRVRASDAALLAEAGEKQKYAKRTVSAASEGWWGASPGGGYPSVLYPVRPDPDGSAASYAAYSLHYLKVQNFSLGARTWPRLLEVQSRHSGGVPPVCSGEEASPGGRRDWCGPIFLYEASTKYRPDLAKLMTALPPDYFSVRAAIVGLTPAQADLFAGEFLDAAEAGGGGSGGKGAFSLSGFPAGALEDHRAVLEENGVHSVLAALIQNEREAAAAAKREGRPGPGAGPRPGAIALASVFCYRPYLYSDPLAGADHPIGAALGRPEVPVLRIGDSLLSGDVNAATGLAAHLRMIRDLARELGAGQVNN